MNHANNIIRKNWSIRIPCPAHNGIDPNCIIWGNDDKGCIGAKCMSHDCSPNDIIQAFKENEKDNESR